MLVKTSQVYAYELLQPLLVTGGVRSASLQSNDGVHDLLDNLENIRHIPLNGLLGPRYGPPREIRTPDTQVRSLVLYPAELRAVL